MELAELLTCKCGDCAHWQIVRDDVGNSLIRCITCNLRIPAQIVVEDHDMLHWKKSTI
jgi:hypothetical protein